MGLSTHVKYLYKNMIIYSLYKLYITRKIDFILTEFVKRKLKSKYQPV